ncbi:MAG: RNA-binding protein [Eubacteriales bacterium]|nr:RNA-binding protein [Eubacteriales bacterium]
MKDFSNTLVESLTGNDKGKVFVALKTVDDNYILYADGRKRGVEKPKLKKIKHIRVLGKADITDMTRVTNGMLRKATAAYVIKKAVRYLSSGQPTD